MFTARRILPSAIVVFFVLGGSNTTFGDPPHNEGQDDSGTVQSGNTETPTSEDSGYPVDYCKKCKCKDGDIVEEMVAMLAGETKDDDGNCADPENPAAPASGPGPGMAYYSVDTRRLAVRITDRPFNYTAPYGPGARVILNYNSDDTTALPRPRYSNLGARWRLNFVQFVEVDSTGSADSLVMGRGYSTVFQDAGGGVQKPMTNYSQDRLKRITATHYEHYLPDGTVETYNFDGGLGWNSQRRLFLTGITDRYNHTVSFTWQLVPDAGGIAGGARLNKVTDATGKETNLIYENASYPMRITKITDPFGRQVTMQYNPDGKLEKLTDAVGVFSKFTYASSGSRFISSMETSYGVTTFDRGDDINGRFLHITDPTGRQYRLESRNWIDATEFGTEPLPPGKTSEMRSGRYTLYWNPAANGDGRTLANAYAAQWVIDQSTSTVTSLVASFKAPLTNRQWTNYANPVLPGQSGASDAATGIVQVQPDGTTHTQSGTNTTDGQPATYSDGFGRTVTYEYHAGTAPKSLYKIKHTAIVSGNPVETTLLTLEEYDNRRPGKITGVDGTFTRYYYNTHGMLHRVVNAKNEETRIEYNDTVGSAIRGLRISVTEAFGTALARTTGFEYDAYCRLWKVTNHESDLTTLEYDAIGGNPLATLNRLTKVIGPDSTSERVEWDRLHVKKHFDRHNRQTVYDYNQNEEVTSVVTPDNKTVSYLRGNCCGGGIDTLIDAAGNATHWKYDVLGRVTEKWLRWQTPEQVRVQLQTYDTVGRPVHTTDARGNMRTQAYDNEGRLKYIYFTIAPGSTKATPNLTINYEPIFNRPGSVLDGTGTHTFGYVPLNPTDTVYGDGQLASITTAGTSFASYMHTYVYDQLGRESSSALAGVSRSRQWDELGRLLNSTTPLGVTAIGYQNLSDRVLTVDAAGSLLTTYGYENPATHKHRLLSIAHTKPGESIPYSTHAYGYDNLERLNSWTKYAAFPGNPGLGNIEKKWDMFYDASDQLESVGELTKVNGGTSSPTDLHSYGYDTAGNRTSEQRAGGMRSWVANGFNQLTTQQVGGEVEVRGTANVNSNVTVDGQTASVWQDGTQWRWRKTVNAAAGQNTFTIQATEATVPPGFVPQVTNKTLQFNVTPAPAISISYDADGNMLTDGTTSYEWDAENRLVAATNSNSGRIEFAYDAFSRRVRVTEPVAGSSQQRIKHLIWDGLTIVQQNTYLGTHLEETRDYFGNGERRTFPSSAAQNLLYTTDHLGSVREVVDKTTGAIRVRYDYTPYGVRSKAPGVWNLDSDFGFTGHYTNDRSGLVLAPYRAFETKLGRWLSRDPIGEGGGINLYGYVRNRPSWLVDPTGLVPPELIDQLQKAMMLQKTLLEEACATKDQTTRKMLENLLKASSKEIDTLRTRAWAIAAEETAAAEAAASRTLGQKALEGGVLIGSRTLGAIAFFLTPSTAYGGEMPPWKPCDSLRGGSVGLRD